MRHATLLPLFLLVACSSGGLSVRQQFLAESGVSVRFDMWVRSINNQDMDSVALMYHHAPELRVLKPDGTVTRGWREEQENWTEFFNDRTMVNFVTEGLEFDVVSDRFVTMMFRHSLDAERVDGNRDPTVSGLGTMVWTKDVVDGLWKIRMLHLSVRARGRGPV